MPNIDIKLDTESPMPLNIKAKKTPIAIKIIDVLSISNHPERLFSSICL